MSETNYRHVKKITEHSLIGNALRDQIRLMVKFGVQVWSLKIIAIIGPASPRMCASYEQDKRTGWHIEVGCDWITINLAKEFEEAEVRLALMALTGKT